MNALEQFLATHKLSELDAMNKLQDAGIISDLCVNACEVAEADQMNAVSFLFGS
jgi:hypothetical protein